MAERLHSRMISIHALRKESDPRGTLYIITLSISIHALRKESDIHETCLRQSLAISIHALRKESDKYLNRLRSIEMNFNPRSP